MECVGVVMVRERSNFMTETKVIFMTISHSFIKNGGLP